MSEGKRLLRYLIPGTVFELSLAAWFLADSWACQCHQTVEVDSPAFVALLAGAAVPVGFLAASIAAAIAWFGPLHWVFERAPSEELVEGWDGGEVPEGIGSQGEISAARADLLLFGHEKDWLAPAGDRARSLMDLTHALENAAVAVWLSAGLVAVMTLVGRPDGTLFDMRTTLTITVTSALVLLGAFFTLSARRVRRITNAYLFGLKALVRTGNLADR